MAGRRKSPVRLEHVEAEACTVDLRLDILGRVPFFYDLPPAELEQVNLLFRENGNTPGEVIYHAGDPAAYLHVVADGRVKLIHHTLTGQDVLLDIMIPGDFFGSLIAAGEDIYPDSAVALTPACVLRIEREPFRELLKRYPSVSLALLDITAGRLRQSQEMVRQLSAHSVEQRIAHVLLRLAAKVGEESEAGLLIQMPLSRDNLAEMAGTTPESASRVMSQLQKEGHIRSGRQWVAIADVAGLQALTAN
jgi:CRP-like cAMP-binding protein